MDAIPYNEFTRKGITMKSQRHNLNLFRALTGKTTYTPRPGIVQNPYGYWPAKVKKYEWKE